MSLTQLYVDIAYTKVSKTKAWVSLKQLCKDEWEVLGRVEGRRKRLLHQADTRAQAFTGNHHFWGNFPWLQKILCEKHC